MVSPELNKILNELKPHKKLLFLIAITGIIVGLGSAAYGLLLRDLTNFLNQGNVEKVIYISSLALGLSFLTNGSRYIHIYNMNCVGEMVGQRIRQKLLSHFLKLNLSFHSHFQTGSGGMLNRVLTDTQMIQTNLRMVADIFLHPIQMIGALTSLFILDWKLTLSLFAIVPFLALFHRSITRSLKKYVPIGQEQNEIMTSTIKEAIDGVRTIQSYNLENKIDQKLKSQSEQFLATRRKVHSRIEISGPFSEFLATIVVLGVMVYLTYQISTGVATGGTMVGYITSILLLSPSIKKLQENTVKLEEIKVSAQRVFEILEDHRTVPESSSPKSFPREWQSIQFKDVNFKFGDRPVLKSINIEARRGEKIALVGESGSGKSTILNLLERFYDPEQGQILIGQVPISDISLKELRDKMALVSQDIFLFRESISENIAVTKPDVQKDQIESAAKKANAFHFVQRLSQGFSTNVGDRGVLLSGGEKQRISIARAILKDADILLLDEATSALDSESEREVQKSLDMAIQNKTAIIVSHRLSTIQNVDRIYVLDKGEVCEVGTHDELLQKKGIYFKLWTIQSMS
jgi:subfamily B ATP-binding cassette protein MsbA